MNRVTDKILAGTLGELVQARLLQYGVQATPPIKDSGNDLIAVNGKEFRAVSIRTTTAGSYNKPPSARLYHVLAVVYLEGHERDVSLDGSQVFLVPRSEVVAASRRHEKLGKYKLTRKLIEQLFGELPA